MHQSVTKITVCKSAARSLQLVYETILKIRTYWLLCGCADDAQRYSGAGSACVIVGPSPQPRKTRVSLGPQFWFGLGRGLSDCLHLLHAHG